MKRLILVDDDLVGIAVDASEYIVVYKDKVVERFEAVGAERATKKRTKKGTLYIRVGDQ